MPVQINVFFLVPHLSYSTTYPLCPTQRDPPNSLSQQTVPSNLLPTGRASVCVHSSVSVYRCGGEGVRRKPAWTKESERGGRRGCVTGGCLKVLPFSRNINEEQAIAKGPSDRQTEKDKKERNKTKTWEEERERENKGPKIVYIAVTDKMLYMAK